ncbi:hypothetical protein [Streptomyces sp.]|uniref:hypothetical protein n=1 Tax=Streptomyces sp. TaxID=1931 RepID=UPI002F946768
MTLDISQRIRHITDHGGVRQSMEALHFHGFTVTIHSPKTSPDGVYAVTAYGSAGRSPETLRGSHKHLDCALKAVAVQLGGLRLKAYAQHVLGEQAAS